MQTLSQSMMNKIYHKRHTFIRDRLQQLPVCFFIVNYFLLYPFFLSFFILNFTLIIISSFLTLKHTFKQKTKLSLICYLKLSCKSSSPNQMKSFWGKIQGSFTLALPSLQVQSQNAPSLLVEWYSSVTLEEKAS